MQTANLLKYFVVASVFYNSLAYPAFDTSFLVSSEMGNRLAVEEFPLTLELEPERLFVTQPTLIFLDQKRLGFRVRFQAYDHRPGSTVAISETGDAQFSGELDFDPVEQQILLHNPQLDRLEFDRDNPEASRLSRKIRKAWQEQVNNPLQADIPPHPYITPFKDNIRNISYDGQNIKLHISYD